MTKKSLALRFNQGKPDWTLVDFKSLLPLVDVMTYGATKYEKDNWKLECEDPIQHIQSGLRHMLELANGNEVDAESGLPHSGHIIANMMMYNYHKYGKNYEFKFSESIRDGKDSKEVESGGRRPRFSGIKIGKKWPFFSMVRD